ncbi:MAG: beta-N-acetylglucosaminidase domain-containing protein [Candidatus Hydrogenedentota bacterium]
MSETTWFGVVEGFYGRPWTAVERSELFGWMNDSGTLSTYMYAPKDDLLHRGRWRELYADAEADALRDVITLTRSKGIRFVYSIAPGLDIQYASDDDRAKLVAKVDQIVGLGCTEFAILFDDIPESLCEDDAKQFSSFAQAQAVVSNFMFEHLKANVEGVTLLFCPTTYCGRMAVPDVPGDAYLNELGGALHSDIGFVWTGPDVLSETISVESIRELATVIQRKPVIWDNIHANDYDNRRYFAGPFAGRPLELRDEVLGILTNPNCEFELNYIPIYSLGHYLAAEDEWDARADYLELLQGFKARHGFTSADADELDITLLTDCFYLPYEHGATARAFLELIGFLFANDVSDWGDRYAEFQSIVQQSSHVLDELNNISNRELLYALYGPVWMLRKEFGLVAQILEWKSKGAEGDCRSVYHHSATYRGAMSDHLQSFFYMTKDDVLNPR